MGLFESEIVAALSSDTESNKFDPNLLKAISTKEPHKEQKPAASNSMQETAGLFSKLKQRTNEEPGRESYITNSVNLFL